MSAASLIGCGVLTGSGAVFNRARVQPGESVAVLGVGGIGLIVLRLAHMIDNPIDFGPAFDKGAEQGDVTRAVIETDAEAGIAGALPEIIKGATRPFVGAVFVVDAIAETTGRLLVNGLV